MEPNDQGQLNQTTQDQLVDEISVLEKQILEQKNLPESLKVKAVGMIARLRKMTLQGSYSREFEPVSEYINWLIQIPFGKFTEDNLDLKNAQEELNANHYGLQPVKNRILEYLAVIKLQQMKAAQDEQPVAPSPSNENQVQAQPQDQQTQQPQGQSAENNQPAPAPAPKEKNSSAEMQKLQGSSSHAPILCFVGIQGVGKTTMAKSIANSLGREFVRISLGGLGNVTEIRGRSRGEIDAEPGQIVKSLVRTEVMNPLILLDEIDKVSGTTGLRSDVMASLLEILDPEQNSTFMDKYIDYPLDLSNAIFITTANNLGGISAALLDRLEVIRFGSYRDEDKIQIAKNYLLPKVRKATGIGEDQLSFDDNVWPLVIRPLGFDAGVRQLERTLTDLARKVALQIVQGTAKGAHITEQNFRQYIPEQIGIYS